MDDSKSVLVEIGQFWMISDEFWLNLVNSGRFVVNFGSFKVNFGGFEVKINDCIHNSLSNLQYLILKCSAIFKMIEFSNNLSG